MASNEQLRFKTIGQTPKSIVTDDDTQWTDLAEKDDVELTPAPVPVPSCTPAPYPGPFPLPQNLGQVCPPQPFGGPSLQSHQPYFHPPGVAVYDVFGHTLPNEQSILEAQLVHLAEVTLGVTTAVSVLERHLIPGAPTSKQREITLPRYEPHFSRVDLRSGFMSSERMTSSQFVRDLGYLIGLKRAVKLLQSAADEDLERVTYKVTVQAPPPAPAPLPPQPFPTFMQAHEFRTVAKDIIKDTVKEYTEETSKTGGEEVQKEMIKLCRAALTRDSE
jgi:hypothetical protein